MTRFSCILLALAVMAAPALAEPQPVLEGNIAIHDPSVIEVDGQLASFATGVERAADGGTPRTKYSADGITWIETGALPGGVPEWVSEELGLTPPNLWAPSVSARDGTFYLYYSGSTFGRNNSVIGLMTNQAFDVADPSSGWVDQGMVIRSFTSSDHNAIDPFRVDLEDGTAWLAFGSHWDGIRLIQIDPVSGLQRNRMAPLPIASRDGGAIEAPAILEHEDHFYLFVSFDACCRGVASTYRIMVGRAENVRGPYLDRDGVPLMEGGGTELQAAVGRFRGPGGQEVFRRGAEPWLAYHYYDRDAGGVPRLQIAPLHFDEDGWPFLDPLPSEEP